MDIFEDYFKEYLEKQAATDSLRTTRDMRLSADGRYIWLSGKRLLNFSSNNYLGLTSHPRMIKSVQDAIEKCGTGGGASRLVCGNHEYYSLLETELAGFKGTESALVFPTGYHANLGIITSLMGRHDVIFSDKYNHASIVDACILSGARVERYKHNDMNHLQSLLKKHTGTPKKLIVTDSIFSMDGDFAPLGSIVSLAEKYGCLTMVDEAHATGIWGEHFRGSAEYFNVEEKIDVHMGTFSKALGGLGGYAAGSKTLTDFLVNKARTFIYTTALPPSVAAGNLTALKIVRDEPDLPLMVIEKSKYLLQGLKEKEFDTGNSSSQIIPVILGDNKTAIRYFERLKEKGLFVLPVRPPTVPRGTSRLRISITARHTDDDIEKLLDGLARK